ncbi:MAG: hypothetical protein AAFR82_00890 [Pseudomonadota bacterium]
MIRFYAFLLMLTVVACDATDETPQAEAVEEASVSAEIEPPLPFEEEFLTACTSKSTGTPSGFYGTDEITRDSYCACLFDTAMRNLSEDERLVAAFYLLGQSGVDTQNRLEFKQIDPMAMGAGSAAVGRAVSRCGG